jgi:hypothetical protein
MFGRKSKDAIVPNNNNKIKPSSTITNTAPPITVDINMLQQLRSIQTVTNSEYIIIGLLGLR